MLLERDTSKMRTDQISRWRDRPLPWEREAQGGREPQSQQPVRNERPGTDPRRPFGPSDRPTNGSNTTAAPPARFKTLPLSPRYVRSVAPADVSDRPEMHWNLAFMGVMLYMIVEYSRLPEMYPILAPLQLGKLSIVMAAIGYFANSRLRSSPSSAKTLDLTILIFVVGNLFSAIFSEYQQNVWGGFIDVALWGAVYFLMTRTLGSKWQIRTFLGVLFLLNLKLAQHTVRDYVNLRSSGMDQMDIILRGGAGQGQSSFFGNVADLGLAMAVVWGMTWALLLGKAETKKLPRFYLLVCFAGFLLAILFCGSRGAVVGAVAITLVALIRAKKVGAIFLAIVFALCLWLVLPDATKVRFQSAWHWQNDANAASRVAFWGEGLKMWEHNPIFGVGPDNFMVVNPYHYVSHSLYIQVLAESGTIGSLCFLAMLFQFLRLNARTRRRALECRAAGKRSFEYCLAFGLDLGMVGYLTSGAFLAVFYYPHLWIMLGLSVALNKSLNNKESEPQPAANPEGKLALATP